MLEQWKKKRTEGKEAILAKYFRDLRHLRTVVPTHDHDIRTERDAFMALRSELWFAKKKISSRYSIGESFLQPT